MASSLTLGGLASNLPGGQAIFGPNTVTASKATPEIQNVELEAGVEKKIPLPSEAVQWAVFFQYEGSPPEVTIKSGASSLVVPALGFASAPVAAGVKELGFKAATVPKVFQLAVI
jgi:hypothetical protein